MPRVFVSYSHDSDAHRAAVLALAQQLRRSGVDCWIDQFEPDPDDGWATWMRDQIDRADRILIVPTETYQRRFYGRERPNVGNGSRWEGLILTDRLYYRKRPEVPIRAILVGAARADHIPDVLSTHTFYANGEDFLRHLRGEVGALPAPLPEAQVASWTLAQAGVSARAELERFVVRSLTGAELDRILALQALDDLRAALPKSEFVGLAAYTTSFLDTLARREELARPGVWDRMREIQTRRHAEIDALQAQWG